MQKRTRDLEIHHHKEFTIQIIHGGIEEYSAPSDDILGALRGVTWYIKEKYDLYGLKRVLSLIDKLRGPIN